MRPTGRQTDLSSTNCQGPSRMWAPSSLSAKHNLFKGDFQMLLVGSKWERFSQHNRSFLLVTDCFDELESCFIHLTELVNVRVVCNPFQHTVLPAHAAQWGKTWSHSQTTCPVMSGLKKGVGVTPKQNGKPPRLPLEETVPSSLLWHLKKVLVSTRRILGKPWGWDGNPVSKHVLQGLF